MLNVMHHQYNLYYVEWIVSGTREKDFILFHDNQTVSVVLGAHYEHHSLRRLTERRWDSVEGKLERIPPNRDFYLITKRYKLEKVRNSQKFDSAPLGFYYFLGCKITKQVLVYRELRPGTDNT